MSTRFVLTAYVLFGLASVQPALAQDDPAAAEDPAHDEIRALRDGALEAFKKHDVDALLSYLHPNVVVTYQNAEVSRGHDGVRAFHAKMSEGDNRMVQSLESEFSVDELSILHGGDTAIAFGKMDDNFQLSNGMQFSLDSRWTATMVKEEDRWSVAALHVSTNMFDNGVQSLMLRWNSLKYGAGAGIIGLLVGALAVVLLRKGKQPSESGAAENAE